MPANFKTAVTYCKSRHPVGSDEFDACYAKQTGPNANHSFINSRKNRKNEYNPVPHVRNRLGHRKEFFCKCF